MIKLLEELKSHSSKWMKSKDELLHNFYWQNGYGAFSINPSEADTVISYISNQQEHHRKITFQDEYKAFLKKHKVAYDEHYLWDTLIIKILRPFRAKQNIFFHGSMPHAYI